MSIFIKNLIILRKWINQYLNKTCFWIIVDVLEFRLGIWVWLQWHYMSKKPVKMKVSVTQLYLTLCKPMDYITCLSSSMGFSRQDTEVGCCSLFQGIFPTQELNPGLPQCKQILYRATREAWEVYANKRENDQVLSRDSYERLGGAKREKDSTLFFAFAPWRLCWKCKQVTYYLYFYRASELTKHFYLSSLIL